jgi:hypothetical protein
LTGKRHPTWLSVKRLKCCDAHNRTFSVQDHFFTPTWCRQCKGNHAAKNEARRLFPYVKKSVNLFFVIFLRREVPMVGVDLRQSLCISALEAIAQLPARKEKVPSVHEGNSVFQ